MKKNIIVLAIIIIVGGAIIYFLANMPLGNNNLTQNPVPEATAPQDQNQNQDDNSDLAQNPTPATTIPAQDANAAAETQAKESENKIQSVIGKSVAQREIAAYHFGTGEKEILLVGGIHGGYAWNTALLGYQMVDYLKTNPNAIPANVKITVIPVLNPDGLSKVVSATGPFKSADVSTSQEAKVAGRFNGTPVDLNRNFDCSWKASGVWQNKTVSGGTAAFSEPESAAIRDYAQAHKPAAVVAWYSAGGGVYSSSCGNGILPETQTITDIYAKAAGYAAYKNFESYQVSGDMTDWFAKNNVPAIGVLLTKPDSTEWEKNLAGIKSLLEYYSK